MIYKIKTATYLDAYNLFSSLPFYTLKNLIHKDDLLIKEENIINIEVINFKDRKQYFLNYKDDYYHGPIQLKNINIDSFKSVTIIFSKFDDSKFIKDIFLDYKFWVISPATYLILYYAIIGYGLINFRHDLFPEILNPKPYINTACNEKCISMTGIGMSALTFLYMMTVGSFLFGLLLIYLSKHYSNLKHYKKSLNYLTIFMVVESIILFQAISPLADPKILVGIKKMYLVRYDKEYIKSHPHRGIASKNTAAP